MLESNGAETEEVPYKDTAAMQWCENAAALTGTNWIYLKIQQKAFESLQPKRLDNLLALRGSKLF